jgi:hypothetical protein
MDDATAALADADPVSLQANALGSASNSLASLLQAGLGAWQTVEQIKATKSETRLNQAAQAQANSLAANASTSSTSSGMPSWLPWAAAGVAVVGVLFIVLRK